MQKFWNVKEIFGKYCANIGKISCNNCVNIVQILWPYCGHIVKILEKFWENTLQMLCNYCANIRLILIKYVTNIGQIFSKYWANIGHILGEWVKTWHLKRLSPLKIRIFFYSNRVFIWEITLCTIFYSIIARHFTVTDRLLLGTFDMWICLY